MELSILSPNDAPPTAAAPLSPSSSSSSTHGGRTMTPSPPTTSSFDGEDPEEHTYEAWAHEEEDEDEGLPSTVPTAPLPSLPPSKHPPQALINPWRRINIGTPTHPPTHLSYSSSIVTQAINHIQSSFPFPPINQPALFSIHTGLTLGSFIYNLTSTFLAIPMGFYIIQDLKMDGKGLNVYSTMMVKKPTHPYIQPLSLHTSNSTHPPTHLPKQTASTPSFSTPFWAVV